jgi:GH24 family phage-related lysozyme (muramidase)
MSATTRPPNKPPRTTTAAPGAGDAQTVGREDANFEALMVLREGRRDVVYRDSRGLPTVGIGHLVVPADHLAVGDKITGDRINALFRQDSAAAMTAARVQAVQAGIADPVFIPYLASVNFQLGANWTAKFPNTWKLIEIGQYEAAAQALAGTPWCRETPVRVADFQKALRALPSKQPAS